MESLVRRSTVIFPVKIPRCVEKAHLRGADVIILNLEDAVPSQEKAGARRPIREAIPLVSRGGGEVSVRLNHDPAHLTEDLRATIHPHQVPVLNRIFSPSPEKVDHARRVAAAFEDGLRNGTASVQVDGAMVDTPVYRRAQHVLERAAAIAETGTRKAAALARLT